MNTKQIRFIILHSIVLTHLWGRDVSVNEAGLHWAKTHLAIDFRENHI